MTFIFPYIGNNHPNWLIFFRGVGTTNQDGYVLKSFGSMTYHIFNTFQLWSAITNSLTNEFVQKYGPLESTCEKTSTCRRSHGPHLIPFVSIDKLYDNLLVAMISYIWIYIHMYICIHISMDKYFIHIWECLKRNNPICFLKPWHNIRLVQKSHRSLSKSIDSATRNSSSTTLVALCRNFTGNLRTSNRNVVKQILCNFVTW